MRILTNENTSLSINDISDDIAEDIKYGILDYEDVKNVDYKFIPIVFLETFHAPAVDIQLGPYRVQMPMDWSIVIGDKHSGELEIIELKKINDRPFQAFSLNPITGFMPEFLDIEIVNIFPDVKWHFPKLKYGHILTIPLTLKPNPPCCLFLKDINKIPDQLDITQMV